MILFKEVKNTTKKGEKILYQVFNNGYLQSTVLPELVPSLIFTLSTCGVDYELEHLGDKDD